MPRLGWRWLLALSALPSFLLLVFYTLTPESPRYLCLKGRKNEALIILKKIAKLNGKELPPGVVVAGNEIELQGNNHLPESKDKDVCAAPPPPPPPPPKQKDSHMGVFKSVLIIFSPRLVRSTLLLWVVIFANAFSYYGLVLLTTELNDRSNTCHQTKKQSQKPANINYKQVFITSFAGTISYLLEKSFYLCGKADSCTLFKEA